LTVTESPSLLSLRQSAQELNIGLTLLRRLIDKGDLPVVCLGGRRLVEAGALDELIARRRRGGSPS
jgi:excisionase family DNA binding protein